MTLHNVFPCLFSIQRFERHKLPQNSLDYYLACLANLAAMFWFNKFSHKQLNLLDVLLMSDRTYVALISKMTSASKLTSLIPAVTSTIYIDLARP